jgi:type 1 glutamine amidotransferase
MDRQSAGELSQQVAMEERMRTRGTLMVLSLALACGSGSVTDRARSHRDAAAPGVEEIPGGSGGGPSVPADSGSGGSAGRDSGPSAFGGSDAAQEADAGDPDGSGGSAVPDAAAIRDVAVRADAGGAPGGGLRMLILSKTLEYHHDSIPACQQMLRELGSTPDGSLPAGAQPGSQWTVTIASEDLSDFTDESLRRYAIIFWCNPTGTVFTSAGATGVVARAAIEKYLTSGGAWGGVHSATDFENTHGWPWFQDQVNGGNFASHDGDGTPGSIVWQPGALEHPVIRGIKSPWSCADEWYFLNRDPGTLPGFVVLGKLASDQRPVVYVREIPGGGRSFYTVRGHNITAYAEPNFRRLIHQGVLWAIKRIK